MAKYGVPVYGNNGEVIGYSFDNDGDGTYDDYTPATQISSGSGSAIIATDDDGDGTYDDAHFVVVHQPDEGIPHRPHHYNNEDNSKIRPNSNKSIFSVGLKVKIAIVSALTLFAISFVLPFILFGYIFLFGR